MKIGEKKPPLRGDEKMEQLVHDLERNEDFLAHIARAREIPNPQERTSSLIEVCRLFGIDWEVLNYINEKKPEILSSLIGKLDMCVIGYSTEEDLFGTPLIPQTEKQLHREAYPSTLDIHYLASKEDVHIFIDAHWKEIEDWRRFVLGQTKPRKFRPRPEAQMNEFAYNHREMDRKELLKLIKKEFGKDYHFGYENLNALIRDEGRRRNRDLKK
jgi:hypothetical protein